MTSANGVAPSPAPLLAPAVFRALLAHFSNNVNALASFADVPIHAITELKAGRPVRPADLSALARAADKRLGSARVSEIQHHALVSAQEEGKALFDRDGAVIGVVLDAPDAPGEPDAGLIDCKRCGPQPPSAFLAVSRFKRGYGPYCQACFSAVMKEAHQKQGKATGPIPARSSSPSSALITPDQVLAFLAQYEDLEREVQGLRGRVGELEKYQAIVESLQATLGGKGKANG